MKQVISKETGKFLPTYYIDRYVTWVLDDEKYFTYDDSNMQENENYYPNDKSKCLKYPNKVMVWSAIFIEVRGIPFGH